jgi:AraC-like DNA-binding protein
MFYEYNHLGSPDYMKVEKGENFSFPPHLHQCFELITLFSGEMEITVDKKIFKIKKGEALLIFPNQIHSLYSQKSEHMLCIFSPKLVQSFWVKLSGKIPENNKFYPDDYLLSSLAKITPESKTAEKKGILYSLCGQFDKDANYKKRESDKKDLLYKIFSFVDDYYKTDCSLEKLSHTIGYDYSYISRYFKKTVGLSFNSYVNHYRLSSACYLLENTESPIINCAYESGFVSLRTFNRNFKSYFKITPQEYRNKS